MRCIKQLISTTRCRVTYFMLARACLGGSEGDLTPPLSKIKNKTTKELTVKLTKFNIIKNFYIFF